MSGRVLSVFMRLQFYPPESAQTRAENGSRDPEQSWSVRSSSRQEVELVGAKARHLAQDDLAMDAPGEDAGWIWTNARWDDFGSRSSEGPSPAALSSTPARRVGPTTANKSSTHSGAWRAELGGFGSKREANLEDCPPPWVIRPFHSAHLSRRAASHRGCFTPADTR